jgi:hypothetical protein
MKLEMPRHSLACLIYCASLSASVHGAEPASPPFAGMGIMVGEVTPTGALVQVHLTQTDQLLDGDVPGAAGVVRFVLRPTESTGTGEPEEITLTVLATADRQG